MSILLKERGGWDAAPINSGFQVTLDKSNTLNLASKVPAKTDVTV